MVFYFSKWLCFSTACVVMISAGLAYTFSIYSHDLKMHFALTQQQVNGLGTAGNLGGYLALPAGLFYDSLKSKDRSVSSISGIQFTIVNATWNPCTEVPWPSL